MKKKELTRKRLSSIPCPFLRVVWLLESVAVDAIRRPTPRTTLSPEAFSGRSHRKKMNPVSVKPTPCKDAESVSLAPLLGFSKIDPVYDI